MTIQRNIQYICNDEKNHITSTDIIAEDLVREFVIQDKHIEYYKDLSDKVYLVEHSLQKESLPNRNKKEIIIILGIVSFEEIEELYKLKNKNTIFIVVESNISLFADVLNRKDLKIFESPNLYLYVDNEMENFSLFIESIIKNKDVLYFINNIKYYINSYYRDYDQKNILEVMRHIRQTITTIIDAYGNSIEDSIKGLENHIKNIEHIFSSKDLGELTNKFIGQPAFIISAGPSLEKNIRELKNIQNRGIIIAVDTIVERLLSEGIIPDFMTTIERLPIVYEYFYKDKNIPKETTLVGPSVLDERIFSEFPGNHIIPIRSETGEGEWLRQRLALSPAANMPMGLSCAHVAFGLGVKLGCSPIVLVGQDLAYGENSKSHVKGTEYDNSGKVPEKVEELLDGYYGRKVKSTKIWLQFKMWFESLIQKASLDVINATEGGVHIYGTKRESLKDVITAYCKEEIDVYSTICDTPSYNIDKHILIKNLNVELQGFKNFRNDSLLYLKDLKDFEINSVNLNKAQKLLNTIDLAIPQIMGHSLLSHNLQTQVFQYYWIINGEEKIFSKEYLDIVRRAQLHLLGPVIATMSIIIEKIENLVITLEKGEQNINEVTK